MQEVYSKRKVHIYVDKIKIWHDVQYSMFVILFQGFTAKLKLK